MNNNKKILLSAIKALEKTFKCSVAVHDYSGQLRKYFTHLPHYHLNPFCTTIKYKMSESACVAFDQYSVQRKLSNNPEAFLKFCHHGLIEAVIPLFIEDKLSGALFIGPFIWYSQTLPPDIFKASKKIDNPILESPKTVLPKIDGETAKRIFAFGNLISLNIENLIFQSKDSVYEGGSSRPEKITAFIDTRFKENISIGDLAQSLFLCESRTSQLVKASFNKNFPKLLMLRRIEHAKSLLENSMFSIEIIAAHSGYNDPAYFHRVFKKQTGITPKEFRQKVSKNK
jgi:AraC-like DNA-binding protein/ligand-binding sensor protein